MVQTTYLPAYTRAAHARRRSAPNLAKRGRPLTAWEQAQRTSAMVALQAGRRMVYAMQLPNGIIKIGSTIDVARRARQLSGEVIAMAPGDYREEFDIHRDLVSHRHHGREYYWPHEDVIAVVNDLRTFFEMEPIVA